MTLSPERNGRITASVVGAILGCKGAFNSRDKVVKDLVTAMIGNEVKRFSSRATEHGHVNEARAVQIYVEKNQLANLYYTGDEQRFFPIETWLGATPDGLVDSRGLIEVKCPYSERYIEPSENYYAQMQIQMYCTDRDWCDFVVYWREQDGAEVHHITRIERNQEWLLVNLPKLKTCWDEAQALANNLDRASDLLAPEERTDDEWLMYTNMYKDILANIEHYEQEKESVKRQLISLANEKPASGNGVSLNISQKKGSVKYSEALKKLCPDADLTPWTGEPTTVYTIKVKES